MISIHEYRPEGHKETLLALVQTHSRGKNTKQEQKPTAQHVDIVRGKGIRF